MILKVFRRLADGRNPEVEVTEALAGVGFTHVAEPLGGWVDDGRDLAFAQRFLAGPSRAGPWPRRRCGTSTPTPATRPRRAGTSAPRRTAWGR